MKKIFVTDWGLLFAFVLSAGSGLGLHAAAHAGNHGAWPALTVLHPATSFLFLVLAISHAADHRGWYRAAVKKGTDGKSKVTAALPVTWVLLSVTGIALAGKSGALSPTGLRHYGIGIVTVALSVAHIVGRIPVLRKSLKSGRR